MSRATTILVLALAISLGGCSLIWAPTYPDAAPVPDADLDAYVELPDGGTDAGIDAWEPDAYVPPDGWAPENCDLMSGDEDRDHLADCDDSDCFGAPQCCTAASGTDLSWILSSRADRELQGLLDADLVDTGPAVTVDFGSGSAVRRFACVPLAQGGELRMSWTHASAGNDALAIVLSPSAARGPDGYLDELAVRVDEMSHVWVTEGGSPLPLEPPGSCTTVDARGRHALPPAVALRAIFTPGVFAGRPALLVSLRITGTNAGCVYELVHEHPILVEQLVRTTEPGCDEAPGLWLALEGERRAYSFAETITLENSECAAPGAFAARGTVEATAFGGAPPEMAGGIGAPDLSSASPSRWFLAVDGSLEDRSAERLAGISVRAALGGASSPRSTNWPLIGAPVILPPNSREPSYSFEGGLLAFARAPERATLGYDIWMATESAVTRGSFPSEESILARGSCSALREPTLLTDLPAPDLRLLYRCDLGAASTLGLATFDPLVRDDDILEGLAIHDRILAHDVIVIDRTDALYWALWALAWRPGGGQEVHLFVSRAGPADPPAFVPYAGNPVVTSSDPALCGSSTDCALTSLTVASFPDGDDGGRERLRFLFARSRYEGTPVHDLVALEQPAPDGLRP